MNIITQEERENDVELALGDIIVLSGSAYVVVLVVGGIVARSMKGTGGLFGKYEDLTKFNKEFRKRDGLKDAKVYKSSEYDLMLVKKGVY